MVAVVRALISASLFLVVSGCVLPKKLPQDNPYRTAVVGFIEPGVSTRDEVEQGLGTPFYTFSNGQWWAYCADRRETEWLWFMLAQDNVGGGTFGGDMAHYSLVLEFSDADLVDEVVVIKDKDGCDRSGRICHDCGFLEIRQDGKTTKLIGTLGSDMK